MNKFNLSCVTLLVLIVISSSCTSLRESSKYNFNSSKYYTTIFPTRENKVYLQVEEDSILVYKILQENGVETILEPPVGVFTETSYENGYTTFYNPSFDLDLLTIPIKYRFATQHMPNQLSANINANLYLGYRSDMYRIRYKDLPLGKTEQSISRFGMSLGGFAGIGSEPIFPWVIRDAMDIEYDGVVFSTGAAWILGFNNITAGITLGFDHLLDQNSSHWVYQGKPWLGLAFGINLN